VFHGDAALGLDGAVLGCLSLAFCGAVFGLVLGLAGEPGAPAGGEPEGGNSSDGVKEPPPLIPPSEGAQAAAPIILP
jgi:hypothetical protein